MTDLGNLHCTEDIWIELHGDIYLLNHKDPDNRSMNHTSYKTCENKLTFTISFDNYRTYAIDSDMTICDDSHRSLDHKTGHVLSDKELDVLYLGDYIKENRV